MHAISIIGIPAWVDALRLLGDEGDGLGWRNAGGTWVGEGSAAAVADVAARLRGVGLGGRLLAVQIVPPLRRVEVRQARLDDARRRRETTPGFLLAGARLDDEGRMSLTPEALALDLAQRVGPRRVVDVGCGAGGNAIAFARSGASVDAIEIDPDRARLAEHNAQLYGVALRVRVHVGDARVVLPSLAGEVAFVDPPWGALWNRARTTLADLPLLAELQPLLSRFPVVIAKVPPSFDPGSLPGFEPRAIFGEAPGDRRRVKLVLLERN
jgi:RNA cap guanine-N2 methyltransferase